MSSADMNLKYLSIPWLIALILVCGWSTHLYANSTDAFTQTIPVSAKGEWTTVTLEPGTYFVTVVKGGWNPWGTHVSWFTRADGVLTLYRGWTTRYRVRTTSNGSFETNGTLYSSAGEAVAHAEVISFELTTLQAVHFFVEDPQYYDNGGSLELKIDRPPSALSDKFTDASAERLFQFLQSIDANCDAWCRSQMAAQGLELVSIIVQKRIETGDAVEFIREMGKRIESSPLLRVGSVVSNLLLGLLDTQVFQGIQLFVRDVKEQEHYRWLNYNARHRLEETFADDDMVRPPIQPTSTDNGVNKFDTRVKGGTPIPLDPLLANGFEYEVGPGDPLFVSVIVPALSTSREEYSVQTEANGCWSQVALIHPLREYFFDAPVNRFRIMGVAAETVQGESDGNGSWFAAISFGDDGSFTGTIRPLVDLIDPDVEPHPCVGYSVRNPATNNRYEIVEGTWDFGELVGRYSGGHLVTINDANEQAWLTQTFQMNFPRAYGDDQTYFIGLNDQRVEGQFEWTSGQSLLVSDFGGVFEKEPWSPYQPDNWTGGDPSGENITEMNFKPCERSPGESTCDLDPNFIKVGLWNDAADYSGYAIIEYPERQFKLSPRSTFLRTSSEDKPDYPQSVELSEWSIFPGDLIRIKSNGDLSPAHYQKDNVFYALIGVFDAWYSLSPSSYLDRVQGALEAGVDVVTAPTYYGGLTTDIPQDFAILWDVVVKVPTGATNLFVGVQDSYYADNGDRDSDLGFTITKFPGVAVGTGVSIGFGPSFGTDVMLDKGVSIGAFAIIGSNVQIKQGATLGDNVVIGDLTTINRGVVGGNDVVIGENVVIDRDVKIQNGVFIGDSAHIGQASVICHGAQIGASATLGKNTLVAANTSVAVGSALAGSANLVNLSMCALP